MKQKIFTVTGIDSIKAIWNFALNMILHDGSIECVFRNAQVAKTLKQLGVLFGLWIKEISTQSGMDSKEIHIFLKSNFLVPIYANNPVGDQQEQWSELYWHYMELCEPQRVYRGLMGDPGPALDEYKVDDTAVAKLSKHILRVSLSLSWGFTKEQMREYLEEVQKWGINAGFSLSVPLEFHKYYKSELARHGH